MGTARNEFISRTVEKLETTSSDIYVLIKKDRANLPGLVNCTVEAFDGDILWNNIWLLFMLRKISPDKIIVVVGEIFSHGNVFNTLNLWMKLRMIRRGGLFASYACATNPIEPWESPEKKFNFYFLIVFMGTILATLALFATFAGWLGLMLVIALACYGEFLLRQLKHFTEDAERAKSFSIGNLSFGFLWEGLDRPLTKFDPDLGWKIKAHEFAVQIQVKQLGLSHRWRCKVDGMGRRYTSDVPEQDEKIPAISVYGCSETFGDLLNDEDTYPWLLQEMFPTYKVNNSGAPDYSTYQMLLALENEFVHRRAEIVVICFSSTHEERNINTLNWSFSHRGKRTPSCIHYGEQLDRYKPDGYDRLPFSNNILSIKLLEYKFNKIKFSGRGEQKKRKTTKKILLEIKQLCATNQAGLLIVYIKDQSSSNYADFFHDEGFSWCIFTPTNNGFNKLPTSIELLRPLSEPCLSVGAQKRLAETIGEAIRKYIKGESVKPPTKN